MSMFPPILAILASIVMQQGAPSPDGTPITVNMLPGISSAGIVAQEEYVYEVSWGLFKLGTIRMRANGKLEARAWIDSYDLPFVDLHSVYYTQMDSSFFSKGGHSIDKVGGEWTGLRYIHQAGQSAILVEKTWHTEPMSEPYKVEVNDTIVLDSPRFVDGLSIAFFPRLFLYLQQSIDVPTVLRGKVGRTTFHMKGKRTRERIAALDRPVRVMEVLGSTSAEGIFGMTGDFAGWFSDDEAAVPIKGKLKVLLGNITVELVYWKRKNWEPPT